MFKLVIYVLIPLCVRYVLRKMSLYLLIIQIVMSIVLQNRVLTHQPRH